MTQTATKTKPIDHVLELLPDAKGPNASGWYQAHCPAHTDKNRSLSFKAKEDELGEGIAFYCFADCQRAAIINALGVTEEDLHLRLDTTHRRVSTQVKPITLLDLAVDKHIHWQFLMELGLLDGEETYHTKGGKTYKKKGIIIPYFTVDGKAYARRRLRTALIAKDGSLWNEDDKQSPVAPIPYGLHRLDQARKAGYIVLVEGESDAWTLWLHSIPALGIPGAKLYEKIALMHLEGIGRVYVSQEPDEAGRAFPTNVYRHLIATGYCGEVFALDLASTCGAKDPNDLHKKQGATFGTLFDQAMVQALPLKHTEDATPPRVLLSLDGDSLPDVTIGGQLRNTTAQALEALRRADEKKPSIFVQSARLVQVARDEKKRPIIMQVQVAELKNALTRSANYYREKTMGSGENTVSVDVPVSPPKEVAEAILALNPSEWPFPALEAIVETPVMRPDGSILDIPGYDPATRLYYIPQAGLNACKVPDRPTRHDVDQALSLILDTIGEFDYVGDADRANAIGLYMTPIIRPAIKRHIPMGLVDAPKPGSGKGLLADTVAITATGNTASNLTAPTNEDEWDKRITSLLLQGRSIICIDNLSGTLQSATLDSTLTSDEKEGRVLGFSKMVKAANRATWLATGNNIKLGGDLARRCYRIRLDPKVSRPWMRTGFKHEDLATWVSEHRGELIAAILTIARAWFLAGKPQDESIPSLGTFTNWAKTVGGILNYAGIKGFLSNLEQLYQDADEDSAEWEAFLQTWQEKFEGRAIKVSDLMKELMPPEKSTAGSEEIAGSVASNPLFDALPENLQISLRDRPTSFAIRLGKALEKRVDTAYGNKNLRLKKTIDTNAKQKLWSVVAGSAGGNITHAQSEKISNHSSEFSDENSDGNGCEDYPHYPQASYDGTSQNGLSRDVKSASNSHNGTQALPASSHPSKHASIPPWLTPGTKDWDKQVEKNGLQEMQARRKAWFVEHQEAAVQV